MALFPAPGYGGGVWQFDAPRMLDPVAISIHNLSTSAAAVNTIVAVSIGLYPGIGVPRTPVVRQLLSLAAGETHVLSVPINPPFINADVNGLRHTGRSMFVELSHPYDADTSNNYGESVVSLALIDRRDAAGAVVLGAEPRLPISLGNTTAAPVVYLLSVAPNTVAAQISPAQVTVAPGDSDSVQLSYSLPATSPVDTSVTVVARDPQGNLLGGFTQRLFSN